MGGEEMVMQSRCRCRCCRLLLPLIAIEPRPVLLPQVISAKADDRLASSFQFALRLLVLWWYDKASLTARLPTATRQSAMATTSW